MHFWKQSKLFDAVDGNYWKWCFLCGLFNTTECTALLSGEGAWNISHHVSMHSWTCEPQHLAGWQKQKACFCSPAALVCVGHSAEIKHQHHHNLRYCHVKTTTDHRSAQVLFKHLTLSRLRHCNSLSLQTPFFFSSRVFCLVFAWPQKKGKH